MSMESSTRVFVGGVSEEITQEDLSAAVRSSCGIFRGPVQTQLPSRE